jgi:hypothetical protein
MTTSESHSAAIPRGAASHFAASASASKTLLPMALKTSSSVRLERCRVLETEEHAIDEIAW